MLARDLSSLEVEGVAVAVVRRQAEDADAAVVLQPPELPIVGDVAPDEVAPLCVPGRPLGPQRAGPQPLDRCIGLRQTVEARIDRNDVRVPEIGRRRAVRTEIAWWRRHGAGRCGGARRGLGACGRGPDGDGRSAGAERLDEAAYGA